MQRVWGVEKPGVNAALSDSMLSTWEQPCQETQQAQSHGDDQVFPQGEAQRLKAFLRGPCVQKMSTIGFSAWMFTSFCRLIPLRLPLLRLANLSPEPRCVLQTCEAVFLYIITPHPCPALCNNRPPCSSLNIQNTLSFQVAVVSPPDPSVSLFLHVCLSVLYYFNTLVNSSEALTSVTFLPIGHKG